MESRKRFIYFNIMLAALLYLIMPSSGFAAYLPGERDPVYRAGLANFYRHDYNMAQNYWRQAAKAGNASAQYRLGQLYQQGLGVSVSYVTARYWFKKAAYKGHWLAQNDLGSLYQNGQGGVRSVHLALHWYKKSAAQGYPLAQYNAGKLLFGKNRYSEAIPYLEAAVRAGYREARPLLRDAYVNTGVIPPRPPVAVRPLPLPRYP